MAGIDLATAEARLAAYLAAEAKVLAGQKVELDGQSLTRANLEQIQAGIATWDARVKNLSAAATGRNRSRTLAPGF